MTARCKECNRYIHFGGRGSKLSELCHKGQCEKLFLEIVPFKHYRNKSGQKFDLVQAPEGGHQIFVERLND